MSTAQDPQQLRAEIEQTRADLGETVEALAAKTDIKSRAKEAASDATERAKVAASDAAGRAKEAATDAVGKAREKLDESRHIATDRLAPAVREKAQAPGLGRTALVGAAAMAVTGVILVATSRKKR
ncbi:DUF3618 domain-containing protein [Actinoplanes sp. CA-142083]|uniref:DUF3618 domain-containing protein n=1 Tax=Actinoplanes sp. CA-142083 TaxID=3239903 RepID=UPI003D905393